MSQGIRVLDADLKLSAFNRKFIEHLDYPPGFIRLGMPLEEILRFRTERGDHGPVDVEEHIRQRILAKRGDVTEHRETKLPEGRTILSYHEPMPEGGCVSTYTDITERKEAEQEIAEKSALLDATFENMAQGISVYDADIKLAAFNQQIIDLMDFPPGFLRLGMPYEEIARFKAERGDYGPGDVDEHVRKRVLNRRERKPNRKERTWPNGRVTLMRRDVLPDGGYVSTHTDITERKRAEEEIAEKSALLDTTFETMSQGIAVFDADLRLTAFNQRYLDLRDYPKGYISLGMSYEQIVCFNAERGDYGPGDSEKQVKERLKAARQGKPWRREYTRADGTALAVGFDPVPGGGFVATITDITERKRAEKALQKAHDVLESRVMERTKELRDANRKLRREIAERKTMSMALEEATEHYRQLLESTNAIPWEADAKTWMFTYVGPQAVELLGYPLELWLEKDFWVDHIHPEDRAKTIDYCQKFSAQRENYELEYRMITADGRVIWLEDIVNVMKQEGDPVTLRGFMLDITERKSLEDLQRNTSARLINAQEEERRKIARELHDDFGQRLALLAVNIQGLGQRISEPEFEGAKSLDKLWSQTRKLSTDLHRLSHQLHPAILHQLGLGPAIRSLCNEISEQHGIQIKFTEHEVPASISRDIALCLYRTVQEGLRNIVKHSEAKDAKVELTGGPDTIHLRITDRGVGFDPETTKGKGLGLISIEERIRLVQGEMSLQSRPAHGTCIDLRIPWATPDA